MRAAFPANPEQQRRILNQSISGAARKTIVRAAKSLAHRGDGSGALAESIAPRALSRSTALSRGAVSSIVVTPVRSNKKAIGMYIAHYYTSRGRVPPASILTSGIRYGHLVEFGHATRGGGFVGAHPFLWPAATSQSGAYKQQVAVSLKRKIELAVRRKAKK